MRLRGENWCSTMGLMGWLNTAFQLSRRGSLPFREILPTSTLRAPRAAELSDLAMLLRRALEGILLWGVADDALHAPRLE